MQYFLIYFTIKISQTDLVDFRCKRDNIIIAAKLFLDRVAIIRFTNDLSLLSFVVRP